VLPVGVLYMLVCASVSFCVKLHLRDGRTDRRREYDSRRLSVRPFVFDTVDAWQRLRHGVTAAIAVDVVATRVRSSVRLLDGV